MTKNEAKETFLSNSFLYGYSDDKNILNKDTIEYIIDEIFNSIKKTIPIYKFYAIQLKIGDVLYSVYEDKKINIVNIVNDDIGMYIYLDNDKTFYFENNKYLEDVFILLREV